MNSFKYTYVSPIYLHVNHASLPLNLPHITNGNVMYLGISIMYTNPSLGDEFSLSEMGGFN